ncbi:DUF418 domain-containing protein [Desulfonema magnum]|uniref:DUF1624 and DUF418 n=1 Tax=Desulfonema magnum TaxID=45655 RepID=A0A975BJ98_9BACT|nr:DUF418 domain-containing protein [Desulfonema magnum]QTA86602.1 DUF1624 and DUF418 [Desulfonema magnum]
MKKNKNIRNHPLADSQTPKAVLERIAGYDIARGVAIFFMIIINFSCVFSVTESDPLWLFRIVETFEGRAAATFVILAGVGISLLCRPARLANDKAGIRNNQKMLLRRAFFLIITGLSFCYTWPPDILHFYGIYLIIAVFFLTASDRRLLMTAFFSAIVFYVLLFFFDYGAGWDGETSYYADIFTIKGMIRNLCFNGFYPIFPWTVFLFVGMWLGRKDAGNVQFRKKIIFASLCMIFAAEFASFYLNQAYSTVNNFETGQGKVISYSTVPDEVSLWADVAPFPPSPLFMISGGATALIVIMLSIILAEKYPTAKWLKLFETAGQLSLTFYAAHVLLGINILDMLEYGEEEGIVFSVTSALVFLTGAFMFASFWKKRWKKGPLEWVMREFSDFPVPFRNLRIKTFGVSKTSRVRPH